MGNEVIPVCVRKFFQGVSKGRSNFIMKPLQIGVRKDLQKNHRFLAFLVGDENIDPANVDPQRKERLADLCEDRNQPLSRGFGKFRRFVPQMFDGQMSGFWRVEFTAKTGKPSMIAGNKPVRLPGRRKASVKGSFFRVESIKTGNGYSFSKTFVCALKSVMSLSQ